MVRTLLVHVAGVAEEVVAESHGAYAPKPLLRIVSPLAEGADRLVAHEALTVGADLQCPLPFLASEYESDFHTERSREEFRALLGRASSVFALDGARGPAGTEARAYERVGRLVLRHSDVLLALWDGKGAAGTGGTAQIVEEAVASGIPVVWLPLDAPTEPRVLVSAVPSPTTESLATLTPTLRQLLLPPDTREARAMHRRYFSGADRAPARLSLYRALRAAAGFGGGRRSATSPESAADRATTEPSGREHRWADALAELYADRYRNGFIANYLLGALAVLMALLGFRSELAVLLELLTIATILTITSRGLHGAWHERWLQYRMLAEQFRQSRFLRPLGRVPPLTRVDPHGSLADPRRTWAAWMFRARAREWGLGSGSLDPDNLEEMRRHLLREAEAQVGYHAETAAAFLRVHDRLHMVGRAIFLATLAACLLHLAIHRLPSFVGDPGDRANAVLTLVAAVLPAAGAALAAIATQAEFGRLARRSGGMAESLRRVAAPVEVAGSPTGDRLGDVAEALATLMTDELLDWQAIFREKPLTLPS